MTILNLLRRFAAALRQLIAPAYKPERHYMRGPGPATLRRSAGKM
ncbi:hypothetical protein [Aquamicrobium defluvii]|uniref:Uncharacterized protein n=1 Tax=Aquamicrobium defluvii TaxID=69279 RepID=A0A4R6YCA1_9HYPH|nr:hypothetical protein [Aquamicrobium defluvii]TDR33358.1 hypothetical protein DES43_12354 [Aquamicrobium defluvii]